MKFLMGFNNLLIFYFFLPGKLFPFADMFKWMSYGHGSIYQTLAFDVNVKWVCILIFLWVYNYCRWETSWLWSVLLWKKGIFLHSERWFLSTFSILQQCPRTWKLHQRQMPFKDWHWTCLHSRCNISSLCI